MYRVIKVLNNNGVLALDMEKKQEVILLGNGVGFGKKTVSYTHLVYQSVDGTGEGHRGK